MVFENKTYFVHSIDYNNTKINRIVKNNGELNSYIKHFTIVTTKQNYYILQKKSQ